MDVSSSETTAIFSGLIDEITNPIISYTFVVMAINSMGFSRASNEAVLPSITIVGNNYINWNMSSILTIRVTSPVGTTGVILHEDDLNSMSKYFSPNYISIVPDINATSAIFTINFTTPSPYVNPGYNLRSYVVDIFPEIDYFADIYPETGYFNFNNSVFYQIVSP
jgi:hypothetical protein